MGSVTAISTRRGTDAPTVREALDQFLATRRNANPNTQRSYAGALGKVAAQLGPNRKLATVTDTEIGNVVEALWGASAPGTFNQRRAAVGSWLNWNRKKRWDGPQLPEDLERMDDPEDSTLAVEKSVIDRLCKRSDIPVRERCLWRMLYESSSRASAVLALDIGDDLDTTNRRARIKQKGGEVLWIHWGTDTARLLPHVIAGRTEGPLFLSDLRPGPHRRATTAARDIDPETGRVRMSYDRARVLLGRYSGGLRLHQLRHSSATHLAEAGMSTSLIMAKTGHRSLRSLQRYARPGQEAVAAATELLSSPTRKG